MPEAARLGDPIGHSPTMSWLLRGLLIGAGIALLGVAVIGTGGLAAVAIVGGMAATGAGIGELMSQMSFAPKEVVGKIIKGSRNVFIRGRPAACAHVDLADCGKHPGPPKVIATGSGNVYIIGMPAARIGDKTACSAEITKGAGNVFIGGGTQQTDAIEPENLVPPLVHAALFVAGMGAALVLGGPVLAIGGLVGGMAGGVGGNWLGGKVFGEGSDGQKWSMLGGSLVGGYLGTKGAPGAWSLVKRVEVEPTTLGANGASLRLRAETTETIGNSGNAAPVVDRVEAAGEKVTVFRVQGGTPPLASRRLIIIDANGNPVISKTTLNVSVGDPVHAEYFLSKRPGAETTSFDVPKWMGDFIDDQAIPQVGYTTNPANQGGTAPKLVDPTTPGRSYELPDIWAKWLEETAVPGSGKVTKGGTP